MTHAETGAGVRAVFSTLGRDSPILLVGCGNMGAALVAGWRQAGLKPDGLLILDPRPELPQDLANWLGPGRHIRDAAELPGNLTPRLVFLAVKPQQADEALAAMSARIAGAVPLCSIAAGRTIDSLAGLWPNAPIIRAMPNTPAQVGRGVTAFVGWNVADTDLPDLITALFDCCGEVIRLKQEHLMDAVTAVSGSGPAYIFHLAEALAAAARSEGLPEETADVLARETVIGAAMLLAESDRSVSELRKAVTSPGGTTEAALSVLMEGGDSLAALMRRAVHAAVERSRALAR